MALGVAQVKHQTNADGSPDALFANSTVTGNLIVAILSGFAGTPSTTGMTDSKGNTYTRNALFAGGSGVCVAIYSAPITTGGASHTVSHNGATGVLAANLDLIEISGQATAPSFDKNASNSGTSASFTTGATATLSQADEIVIIAVGVDSGSTATITQPAGYTLIGEEENGANVINNCAYLIVSATTAINAAWTTTFASSPWGAAAATYKAAAAAATKAPPFAPRRLSPLLMRRK